MPIIQTRVIALIDAALDYQQALRQVLSAIREHKMSILYGRETVEDAFAFIERYVEEHLLQDPLHTPQTISIEHYHFQKNKHRNEKAAQRELEKRGGVRVKTQYEPAYATDQLHQIASRVTNQEHQQYMRGTAYEPQNLSPIQRRDVEENITASHRRGLESLEQEKQELFGEKFSVTQEEPDQPSLPDEFPKGKDPFTSHSDKT